MNGFLLRSTSLSIQMIAMVMNNASEIAMRGLFCFQLMCCVDESVFFPRRYFLIDCGQKLIFILFFNNPKFLTHNIAWNAFFFYWSMFAIFDCSAEIMFFLVSFLNRIRIFEWWCQSWLIVWLVFRSMNMFVCIYVFWYIENWKVITIFHLHKS